MIPMPFQQAGFAAVIDLSNRIKAELRNYRALRPNVAALEPWTEDHELAEHFRQALIAGEINCYADLHDVFDANVLGDSEQLFEHYNFDQTIDILNGAHDIVDRWIKSGGLEF